MPFAYLCDFDGTISPRDIGAAFADRFSPEGEAGRIGLLDEWLAGRVGHRELTEAQCGLLAVTEDEALGFTRTFRLDPQFAPFAREALGRGDAVMVVSDGNINTTASRMDLVPNEAIPMAYRQGCPDGGCAGDALALVDLSFLLTTLVPFVGLLAVINDGLQFGVLLGVLRDQLLALFFALDE